ncbi:putative glucosamine-phosphate N-acetyltransferase [Rosellinia necatrix]|uniref:Glucosamine 6-phosphate N-acetyltransferase n=1 Tax=Rosellinia necatrix TaxID=77044 RepID=A0A1W2TST1_ROSNE|nr:putative glucosamine-phosphate N-acetyltransferase [Rosellinia necatrix]
MADSQSLFPASLISASVRDGLPDGFVIRPLARNDYGKGFYDCLRVLTWVADPTEPEFLARFDEMAAAKNTYFFTVIEFQDRVIGTGCLVAEKKFIHNHGMCGHIEEIAVAKEHQGKGLGLKMMQALESVAVAVGCYKTILNCGPRNEPFYARCGYHNSGIEMSRYFEEEQDSYHRG